MKLLVAGRAWGAVELTADLLDRDVAAGRHRSERRLARGGARDVPPGQRLRRAARDARRSARPTSRPAAAVGGARRTSRRAADFAEERLRRAAQKEKIAGWSRVRRTHDLRRSASRRARPRRRTRDHPIAGGAGARDRNRDPPGGPLLVPAAARRTSACNLRTADLYSRRSGLIHVMHRAISTQ